MAEAMARVAARAEEARAAAAKAASTEEEEGGGGGGASAALNEAAKQATAEARESRRALKHAARKVRAHSLFPNMAVTNQQRNRHVTLHVGWR